MYFCLSAHFKTHDCESFDFEVAKLKNSFERCLEEGNKIVEWQVIQNEKVTPSVGFINDLCSQVKCQVDGEANPKRYESICRNWVKESESDEFDKDHRPWLTLMDPVKAFEPCRENMHEEMSKMPKYGALYYPSGFFDHDDSYLMFNSMQQCRISFFYDSRRIVINTSSNLKIKIPFSSILKLLIDGTSMIINFMSPPLLFLGNNRVGKGCFGESTSDLVCRSNAILLEFEDLFQPILARLHFFSHKYAFQIHFTAVSVCQKKSFSGNTALFLSDVLPISSFEFAIAYLIEALIRRNLVIQAQGFVDFIKTVKELNVKNTIILEQSLADLVTFSDYGLVQSFSVALRHIFQNHENKCISELCIEPENAKLVRRMIVTPCRIVLWPPELSIENRVLRKFNRDFSLRVNFRDDDFVKLNFRNFATTKLVELEKPDIKNLVNKVFSSGISIAGRHYELLGWSNSQIRDHGAWMYAKDDENNDVKSIRSWMGDFSAIKSVPKFMARMGQCFSQTSDILNYDLQETEYAVIPDITGGYDYEAKETYTFSDGIGQVSQRLITELRNAMKLSKEFSAFQMRFSGMKGMLALNPGLTDKDILFRDSQNKFQCPQSKKLEICKIAQAVPVALNRPFITILDWLKIPAEVFLGMQKKTLLDCTEMFFSEPKAAEYLSMHNLLCGIPFTDLYNCGIRLTDEPFFYGMMLAGHAVDLDMILRKARLPVDPSEGRNMFGVIDENGILEYGQVFVRYTTNLIGQDSNIEYTVLKGTVLVTKNPCYQAGDVRKFEAVDIPELYHHRDCIVFPKKGKRPHPNELSGSDLDGDEYSVIWKKELIFLRRNWRARDFPKAKNVSLEQPIQLTDIINFFEDFLSWDNIGSLATTHLATADYNPQGIFSQQCYHLARQCSIAVDASKNGEFVKAPEEFGLISFPDFLQKYNKPKTYKSKRALGQLYRSCRSICQINITHANMYQDVKVDPLLIYPGWERYQEDALKLRDKYEGYLGSLLTKYGIKNESEAMSGCFTKLHGRFSQKNGRSEIEELMRLLIRDLWTLMEKEFYSDIPNSQTKTINLDDVYCKASAWYVVTYNRKNPSFLSFPWVNTGHLAHLKLHQMSELSRPPAAQPVLDVFAHIIQKNLNNLKPLPPRYTLSSPLPETHVKIAAQLMVTWGYHNKIIPSISGCDEITHRLLDLILKEASREEPEHNVANDVLQNSSQAVNRSGYDAYSLSDLRNAMNLLLRFFSTFMDNKLMDKSLFDASFNKISRMAVYSYQRIAITHNLSVIGLVAENDSSNEVDELSLSYPSSIVEPHGEEKVKKFLKQRTKVDKIYLRIDDADNNVLRILAFGSRTSLIALEDLLENGSEWLDSVLTTGIVPDPTF